MTQTQWQHFCDNYNFDNGSRCADIFTELDDQHTIQGQYRDDMGTYKFAFGSFLAGLNKLADAKSTTYYEIVSDIVGGIPDADTVVSVTFEYAEIFGTTGGSAGTQTFEVVVTTGRSSQNEISESSMVSVTAAMSYSSDFSPLSGSIEVSASYEFSGVYTYASEYQQTKTESQTIDLSMPQYVYQKGVTINYADGHSDYIGVGKFISSEPIGMRTTIDGCKLFK